MNRLIGHQRDLLGGPEVPVWSSGKPPREKKSKQPTKRVRARSADPTPSHQALDGIAKQQGLIEDRIVDAISKHGPSTSHEIAAYTGLSLVTVSPCIKPMRTAGVLKDTGERRDRRSVWGFA